MARHQVPFLECRDLGHAWEAVGDPIVLDRSPVRVSRLLSCLRCKTQRSDTYEQVGDVLRPATRKYTYPEGYLVKGGMTRAEARAKLMMPRRKRGLFK